MLLSQFPLFTSFSSPSSTIHTPPQKQYNSGTYDESSAQWPEPVAEEPSKVEEPEPEDDAPKKKKPRWRNRDKAAASEGAAAEQAPVAV